MEGGFCGAFYWCDDSRGGFSNNHATKVLIRYVKMMDGSTPTYSRLIPDVGSVLFDKMSSEGTFLHSLSVLVSLTKLSMFRLRGGKLENR
jgi:hypothetical protein